MALAVPAVPTTPWSRLRWALIDALTVARYTLAHIRYVPEKLLDVTIQPIMFVLLFAYVFGSAISIPGGGSYKEYLMAGIFAQTMVFASGGSAVGVAESMSKGLIDRFRSLPMARSAVLTGMAFSDFVTSILGLTVMSLSGLVVGWRVHEGLASTLGGFALLLLLGFAMSWFGTFLGLVVRTPESAQALVFIALFPVTFVANTFVPTQGMPTWLRTIADWNPISATVAGCRQLFGNPTVIHPTAWPLQHPVVASVGWSLLILVVFVPLAVRRYLAKN
jgi:ABC-2 type transport system permease protein